MFEEKAMPIQKKEEEASRYKRQSRSESPE